MSEKPQWTPGPWFVDPVFRSEWIDGADGKTVADCRAFSFRTIEENRANAHLIAAAPEMYEALKRQQANIRRWLETGVAADPEESKSISDQIDAALAKAEDRT